MGGASAAINLHKLIREETGYRGEFQVTESLPMCAIDRAVENDLKEAYELGAKAVELALKGTSGVMVTINRVSSYPYKYEIGTAPLKDVAVHAKEMDKSYINPEGNFVTQAFIDYVKPLVGELPKFHELKRIKA